MKCAGSSVARVRAYAAREAHGLVWVSLSKEPANAEPIEPCIPLNGRDTFSMHCVIHAGIEEAAENFLDATHTHFVHGGLVRRDSERKPVCVSVTQLCNGVEARYDDGPDRAALIPRLFDRRRTHSIGRFRLPGLAEIEYYDRKGCTLSISAYFTPMDDDGLVANVVVSTRRGLAPASLKNFILRKVFAIVLRQDVGIVELQHRNRKHFPGVRPLMTQCDVLGPAIRSLLAGDTRTDLQKTLLLQL